MTRHPQVFRLLWHFIRIIIFGNSPRQKEQGYKPFFYEDTRYPRIASNPTDNRKRENRVGYDGPVDGDRWGTYGLFRPRVLLQVDGDSTPKHVRKFNVRRLFLFRLFLFPRADSVSL